MTIHDSFEGALYVATIVTLAEKYSIRLESGSDFDYYAETIAAHRPQPIGVPFDPNLNAIHPDDGFWFLGWDRDGRLVFTQAVRLLRIEGQSLATTSVINTWPFRLRVCRSTLTALSILPDQVRGV